MVCEIEQNVVCKSQENVLVITSTIPNIVLVSICVNVLQKNSSDAKAADAHL